MNTPQARPRLRRRAESRNRINQTRRKEWKTLIIAVGLAYAGIKLGIDPKAWVYFL